MRVFTLFVRRPNSTRIPTIRSEGARRRIAPDIPRGDFGQRSESTTFLLAISSSASFSSEEVPDHLAVATNSRIAVATAESSRADSLAALRFPRYDSRKFPGS